MPALSIDHPAMPSQNVSARSASFAGDSTCTLFLPLSPPFFWPLYPPAMVRAIVLYDDAPDAARYEQHAELCRKVPGATFRHGPVFGAPMGEPKYRYYGEWEFPDMDRSEERRVGKEGR